MLRITVQIEPVYRKEELGVKLQKNIKIHITIFKLRVFIIIF